MSKWGVVLVGSSPRDHSPCGHGWDLFSSGGELTYTSEGTITQRNMLYPKLHVHNYRHIHIYNIPTGGGGGGGGSLAD